MSSRRAARPDLAATIACILLHTEARAPTAQTTGVLREPLIKIVHLLRAMDYVDNEDNELIIKDIAEDLGQGPYESRKSSQSKEFPDLPATVGKSCIHPPKFCANIIRTSEQHKKK